MQFGAQTCMNTFKDDTICILNTDTTVKKMHHASVLKGAWRLWEQVQNHMIVCLGPPFSFQVSLYGLLKQIVANGCLKSSQMQSTAQCLLK